MPPHDDAITRLERNLAKAVEDFSDALRRHVAPSASASEDGAHPPNRGAWDLDALRREEARLRRKARRNAPCYDLNRHIAIRRLIALAGGQPLPA